MSLSTAPIYSIGRANVQYLEEPVEASTAIWSGTYVCANASTGNLVPAQDVASLIFIGQATQSSNNSGGAAQAVSCKVQPLAGINGLQQITINAVSPTQAWVGLDVFFRVSATHSRRSSRPVVVRIALGLVGQRAAEPIRVRVARVGAPTAAPCLRRAKQWNG